MKGIEGDRAERSEVKTCRRHVFRESAAETCDEKHAATGGAGEIFKTKRTPAQPIF